MINKIVALSPGRSTILIVGESGTGKELVARAIHDASAPGSPFVALNCAALPKDLIESELFGFVKGAFSGANHDHLGLFRSAQGGTLFLDEVTEMSQETQAKLFRAIQERAVRPVGGTREIPVDVRIIASTNREPDRAVREGQLPQGPVLSARGWSSCAPRHCANAARTSRCWCGISSSCSTRNSPSRLW